MSNGIDAPIPMNARGSDEEPDSTIPWSEFDHCIQPSRSWVSLQIKELWQYRELLFFLSWRDVKVRYKQTILGAGWAVIQPFLTMIVFTLFFGRLGGMDQRIDGNLPYPLFSFAALVPWTYFANGLTSTSTSVLRSANLIQKVYFPRLVVPISSGLAGLVDLVISFCVLLLLMLYYGILPSWQVLALPAFTLLAFLVSLGVGLWLAALTTQFRDVQYTLSFLVQLWLFATPIAYPSTILPEPWRTLYGINPMAGVVEGFRWALLGTAPPGSMIWVSAFTTFAVLVSGAFYFRRIERTFADNI